MPDNVVYSNSLIVLEKQRIALLHFVSRTKIQKDLWNAKCKKDHPGGMHAVMSRDLVSPPRKPSSYPCNICVYLHKRLQFAYRRCCDKNGEKEKKITKLVSRE